ncbi:hypothetical protein GOP47_0006752 [Adiantum capillus-veneris]|uniref:Uncharacterized protein n=1 Tax=Adiantum capillus-veneris TaxID=13818 RepID=A0A9D4V3H3_ADICA|nr:hypothetical protein GOP47_0006752 [Adiantum capillus-veneris]
MAPLRLQCCIAQFLIYCIASLAVQAQQQQSAAHHNSSFMRLSHSPAFKFSPLAPVNMNVSNIAIPNLDSGYFFPILSSPSFKTWNSSADNPGFLLSTSEDIFSQ